jgi:predicted small integral membrane protein
MGLGRKMIMVRLAKIVLVLAVAFYGAMGVFNFVGWERGLEAVTTITSMSQLPLAAPWATDSAIVAFLGLVFIGGSKLAGGSLCAVGAWKMWSARHASAAEFDESKSYAVLGCVVLLVLFFGGFMYLAANFFGGFRTEFGRASATWAFELGTSVALILLFLNQPEHSNSNDD